MKKALIIITICSVLAIGGIITTYIYLNYADVSTYQNGIFVSREVAQLHETASDLYQNL